MKYLDDKENSDFHLAEHLRFSLGSSSNNYRSSSHDEDDNSAFRMRVSLGSSSTNQRRSSHDEEAFTKRFCGGSNYNHNKKMSRLNEYSNRQKTIRQKANRRKTSKTVSVSSRASDPPPESDGDNVIALFGANGVTGHYFLKFAIEAGYSVRTLVLPGVTLDDMEGNSKLTSVTGNFDEEDKIYRVVRKAAYVVCMLNDCDSTLQDVLGSQQSNFAFIQRLVPIMQQCQKCRLLMYQASAFSSDSMGSRPILSQVVTKVVVGKTKKDKIKEQDQIIEYISTMSDPETFQYIITRPSDLIRDKPSRKKLAASKSQPGPFPITNTDLAEFSLNALKMQNLYNTCPYVVQDGI